MIASGTNHGWPGVLGPTLRVNMRKVTFIGWVRTPRTDTVHDRRVEGSASAVGGGGGWNPGAPSVLPPGASTHALRWTWTRRRRTCTAHDHQAHRDVTVSRVPRTRHGNARGRGLPVGLSGAQHSNPLLDRCDMAVTDECASGAPAAGSGTPRTGCCGESVRSHHWSLPLAPQLHHKGAHDAPGSERQIEPATQPVSGPAIHSHRHTQGCFHGTA